MPKKKSNRNKKGKVQKSPDVQQPSSTNESERDADKRLEDVMPNLERMHQQFKKNIEQKSDEQSH